MELRRNEATDWHVPSLDVHPIAHWAISPDDRYLLVSGPGADASRVWCIDLELEREVASLDGAAPVTALAWPGPGAWIVRAGAAPHATLEVQLLPGTRRLAIVELAGLRALRHHVSAPLASPWALIAKAELDQPDRRDPASRLGWLVDRASGGPVHPIERRDLDCEDVIALGRHVATALAPEGGAIAAGFGPRVVPGGRVQPGLVATLDRCTGRVHTLSRLLDRPALEVVWAAGPTLVVRAARIDAGAHDPVGQVVVVDIARGRVVHDSLARLPDPAMTSEHHVAGTHGEVHPSGGQLVLCGHAMYVPHVRGEVHSFSSVHGRAYVVSIPDGVVRRTLELDTNPWDAVGAVWCDGSDELAVLTASGGRWGIARWTADGAGPPARFERSRVLLGGRLHRSPDGTRHVVTSESWPDRRLHLTIVRAV